MENQNILVTFCNLPAGSNHPLVCLSFSLDSKSTFYYKPVWLGYSGTISSATGIAIHNNRIFVLFFADGRFYLSVLSEADLSSVFIQELPEVKDGHSIIVSQNKLFIVSTGTDEILSYDILEMEVCNPKIIWRASDTGVDTHHVNSIADKDGELFITAFGEKTSNLWSSAVNGYIHNVSQNIRVKEGIYHPHSLNVRQKKLYYCDSSRKAFCSLEKSLFELEGYSRGVGWLSDTLVCVASSIGRRISKSTGLIANPADPGKNLGKSKVAVWDIETRKSLLSIDLSYFGPEIYDVVPLEQKLDGSDFLKLGL